jgi:hypothetical protein
MLRIPRTGGELGRDRERIAAGWLGVAEPEVVDQFLSTHGACRRQLTVAQEPAHIGVRRGVNVDRERRKWIGIHSPESVFFDVVVGFCVERRNVTGTTSQATHCKGEG